MVTRTLLIIAAVVFGLAGGLGLFTFRIRQVLVKSVDYSRQGQVAFEVG